MSQVLRLRSPHAGESKVHKGDSACPLYVVDRAVLVWPFVAHGS
jgi:hypothetical protein